METRYTHPANGAELRRQDLATVADNAALADDHVIWELARTIPGSATPDKLIVPYAARTWAKLSGSSSNALVWGNSADGSIHVNPFRAILGSTVVIGTSAVEHMRGQRSGYYVNSTTNLYSTTALNANASGNPRWTLVYAAVTPDAIGDSTTIVVKDPTTEVVSSSTLVYNRKTTVAIGTVDGTAAASPTYPALPSDGAGTYYIPLAYIYIPNGFNASSTVLRQHIYEVAPTMLPSSAAGGSNFAPADQQFAKGGTVDDRQGGSSSTTRPGAYLPSTMIGEEKVLILLQLGYGTDSHEDGDYVDKSRDWRFRYFKWTAHGKVSSSADNAFASDRTATGTTRLPYHGYINEFGFGQSFNQNSGVTAADYGPVARLIGDDATTKILENSGATVTIAVEKTTGYLIVRLSGTPGAQVIIWLEATGPYSNFATI